MKIELTSLIIVLMNITTAYAAEATDRAGVILSRGDQTIISGIPVSCEAPLVQEGKYMFYCDDYKTKRLALRLEFIEKANATYEEVINRREQLITENNLDINHCLGGVHGPFPISNATGN